MLFLYLSRVQLLSLSLSLPHSLTLTQVLDTTLVLVPHVPLPNEPASPDVTLHDGVVTNGLALWVGDAVYVRAQGDEPMLAVVERFWSDAAGQTWLAGPFGCMCFLLLFFTTPLRSCYLLDSMVSSHCHTHSPRPTPVARDVVCAAP